MKTKLVVFGITGELAAQKLIPALDKLVESNDQVSVIGVTRKQGVTPEELLKKSTAKTSGALSAKLTVYSMDLAKEADYQGLKALVDLRVDEQLLIYLSVPPAAATHIADFIGKVGLNTPNVKLIFEKPFGWDLESAKQLLSQTGDYFRDEQIYRIDHYLAKDIAAAIITRHIENTKSGHAWNNQHVKSIEVLISETQRINQRDSYDQIGALKDVLQNHVLQLLALTIMDVAKGFAWKDVPRLRLRALQDLKSANPVKSMRAQYEGYQDDVNNPGSLTETYVSVELATNDERLNGVNFKLSTGKALDKKEVSVKIIYKDGSNDLFVESGQTDAYLTLIEQAIAGQKDLFISGEEVLESWRILEPIQRAWEMDDNSPVVYPVGTTPELGVSSG